LKRATASKSKKRPTATKRTASRPARKAIASSLVRILVADNHPIDRVGLVAMLQSQSDFRVVGEAGTTDDAIKGIKDNSPSITLLALRLPTPNGRSALARIRQVMPHVPILAMAERGEGQCLVLNPPGRTYNLGPVNPSDHCATGTDCLELAVAQGAAGTIRRTADPEDLFRAIRAVASGKAWYESGTATAIMRHALARNGEKAQAALSDRETQVADLIANGRSNKEIAQALGISEPTVKKHVGHILTKLKLQDRLQIGLYIARNPLVLGTSERN
jgi:DNA-binding NarL/FixJ family response regulator